MMREREPTVRDRPALERPPAAVRPALPGSLAPAGILALQRTAGNAAVTALLAREPAAGAETSPAPAEPDWLRLSSEQPILPGEPVEGVPAVNGRYTDDDRARMRREMHKRFGTNRLRAPRFTGEFCSSVAEIWTSYVVEAMAEAAEQGPPFYAKVLSFAARAALLAAFPEAFVAKELGHFAAELTEKGAEFAGELASEKISEHATTKKAVARKGQELEEQSGGIGGMIAGALVPIMALLADEVSYTEFLDHAPPDELGKFRLPPEIPELDGARLRTIVAGEMIGVVRHPAPIKPDQENIIEARLEVRGPGAVEFTRDPHFKGAEAFAGALEHATIGTLPRVPLYIELEADYTLLVQSTLARRPQALNEAVVMAQAYPSRSPAKITRQPDGGVFVEGGGLAEHLHLYERVHPGEDLGALIVSYAHDVAPGDLGPPRTPQLAARRLFGDLQGDVIEGAGFLIRQSVDPSVLGRWPVRLREPDDG